MIGIVAHHYVIHSGLMDQVFAEGAGFSPKNIFIVLLGAWGKIGINCFILITGYFMCKSKITLKKFLRVLFEVMFYNVAINAVFLITGVSDFSLAVIKDALLPIDMTSFDFPSSFLIFYLMIPFANILIRHLNKKQHLFFIAVPVVFFSIIPTFSRTAIGMNYLGLFWIVYAIGAYIRLYFPKPNKTYLKHSIIMTITCVSLVIISVILNLVLGGRNDMYFFIDRPIKLLAILTAVALFMLCINIKMKYHPIINAIAASTFGVLLIHDNSIPMRHWLWVDKLHVTNMYNSEWLYLHAIIAILGVYIVCVGIDRVRMVALEQPLFKLIGSKIDKADEKFQSWIGN